MVKSDKGRVICKQISTWSSTKCGLCKSGAGNEELQIHHLNSESFLRTAWKGKHVLVRRRVQHHSGQPNQPTSVSVVFALSHGVFPYIVLGISFDGIKLRPP